MGLGFRVYGILEGFESVGLDLWELGSCGSPHEKEHSSFDTLLFKVWIWNLFLAWSL